MSAFVFPSGTAISEVQGPRWPFKRPCLMSPKRCLQLPTAKSRTPTFAITLAIQPPLHLKIQGRRLCNMECMDRLSAACLVRRFRHLWEAEKQFGLSALRLRASPKRNTKGYLFSSPPWSGTSRCKDLYYVKSWAERHLHTFLPSPSRGDGTSRQWPLGIGRVTTHLASLRSTFPLTTLQTSKKGHERCHGQWCERQP
jgi:hypothetical protein